MCASLAADCLVFFYFTTLHGSCVWLLDVLPWKNSMPSGWGLLGKSWKVQRERERATHSGHNRESLNQNLIKSCDYCNFFGKEIVWMPPWRPWRPSGETAPATDGVSLSPDRNDLIDFQGNFPSNWNCFGVESRSSGAHYNNILFKWDKGTER